MKTKDILALVVLGIVLVALGSFLVSRFGRGGKARTASIEVVQPIDPNFDDAARQILLGRNNRFQAASFSSPSFDFSQGFGNTNPFRPE